jgi:alginate O-acetyltransferase complex protein AlgI
VVVLQQVVARTGERRYGTVVLWASLIVVLAPMIAWKIWPADFVIRSNVWSNGVLRHGPGWLEAIDFTAPIVAPIGLSFSSFRAADLLIKSNLGLVDRLSPGRVLAYGLFPPLLVVGPIATYDETAKTIEGRVTLDQRRFVRGCTQMLVGLFEVFVIAFVLSWSTGIFVDYPVNPPWRLAIGLVAFAWYFYANFAGYSDLAIGSGALLGADLRPNFDSPYTKTTPAAFWNSWHISLTRFLRTNVYTPMVGRHPQRQFLATIVLMLLIGLWHSITWASAVFGLYHGVSLVLHRFVERRRPPRHTPSLRVAKSVLVFAWFALSLPLLQLDLQGARDFYAAMIGVR